ncbi:MAG: YeeE/YedE family protein [Candidatus Omnitrophica bacterium]|nr:YeeE/YedE family protein [Candidatus Omnitrophota bacterium]
MKNFLTKEKWNPYLAGALVGIVAVCSVVLTTQLMGKPEYLGTSTTFVRAVGFIEKEIAPNHVAGNDYFQKTKIKVDWQMMLVIGIFFGALISSLCSKTFKIELVPAIWKERFGKNASVRAIGAVIGGIIALFGVRLANGCPSGHGLSSMMQLSLSGLIAMMGFMIGGFITAHILYTKKEA